jgi:acyl-coenzyme A synthetase/AMP-(fatty) acid ligase
MISHRTILTFIRWCGSTFGLRRGDRVTSHAPLHFDLSTFDLYVTLDAGATVVLVPDGLSVFPVRLVELLRDERITVAYLVPSIWSLMLTYGALERDSLPDLRLALFAGEVFPIKYLRDLVARLPAARYFNLYGPTETNVCTYYEVQPRDIAPEESRPVPIGVACENTEIIVLDDDGQMVRTPGREGELWVRGSTVAAGYWGDPTGTAVRFVQNPFETRYPDIAYRTGDVVRLDEDGVDWRYVGRRDHMVKSRGYRIELGEIESTLYAHPDVEEAAAVAVPDELIGARIVAYVVASASATSPDVLLEHCRRTLPRYMLPDRIELCDRLPKTSTGKIDRPSLAIA